MPKVTSQFLTSRKFTAHLQNDLNAELWRGDNV